MYFNQCIPISSAKSTTASSKILEIDGLVAWYETVMDDSLSSSSRIDNSSISYWQDISSQYNISEELNKLDGPGNSEIVYRKDGIYDIFINIFGVTFHTPKLN